MHCRKGWILTDLRRAAFRAFVIAMLVGCGRDSGETVDASGFLTNASSEAQVALAVPVDYRLTHENFSRWERAQSNLDRLPQSAFAKTVSSGGNAIENAVARLESSSRARRAIESGGLSVRDFVLLTIALAQAADAAETGRTAVSVPPQNIAFVADHRARVLRAQARRQSGFEVYVEPSLEIDGSWRSKQEAEARASAEQRASGDGFTEISNDPPPIPPIPKVLPRNQIPSTPPALPPIPTQPPLRDSIPNTPPVRDSIPALR